MPPARAAMVEDLRKFETAVLEGDTTWALCLLETGRVSSLISVPAKEASVTNGVEGKIPLLFYAVTYSREDVARAMIRHGADIDKVCVVAGDATVSAAGNEIRSGSVTGLALCHCLRANLLLVGRQPYGDGSDLELSAILYSVLRNSAACLAFLLDTVYPARPIELDKKILPCVSLLAEHGAHSKPLYEVLLARGFDFKNILGKISLGVGERDRMSGADLMLLNARKSGDAGFLRYVVKVLVVTSTTKQLGISKAFVNKPMGFTSEPKASKGPEVPLAKYKCAACKAVCATQWCTGCRVMRYCSKECSVSHWKTGGHKEKCKELKRLKASRRSGSIASSGPSCPQ